jgi:hypothetical protein
MTVAVVSPVMLNEVAGVVVLTVLTSEVNALSVAS